MIKFHCETCDKKIGVPVEYAGKRVKCPKCGQAVRVPDFAGQAPLAAAADAPEQAAPAEDPWSGLDLAGAEAASAVTAAPRPATSPTPGLGQAKCAKCGSAIRADTEFCINCGHPYKPATASVAPRGKDASDRFKAPAAMPVALVGGLVGALCGAFIWVGVVYLTGREIGWAAWGVGLLTALGLRVGARDNSRDFGVAAVILALVGMLAGKFLSVEWVAVPQAKKMISQKSRQKAKDVVRDDKAMFNIACQQLVEDDKLDEDLAELVMGRQDGDEVPPDQMPAVQQAQSQVNAYLAGLTPKEKENLAEVWMGKFANVVFDVVVSKSGYLDRLRWSLSFYDLLWFFLAVASAYKIGAGW